MQMDDIVAMIARLEEPDALRKAVAGEKLFGHLESLPEVSPNLYVPLADGKPARRFMSTLKSDAANANRDMTPAMDEAAIEASLADLEAEVGPLEDDCIRDEDGSPVESLIEMDIREGIEFGYDIPDLPTVAHGEPLNFKATETSKVGEGRTEAGQAFEVDYKVVDEAAPVAQEAPVAVVEAPVVIIAPATIEATPEAPVKAIVLDDDEVREPPQVQGLAVDEFKWFDLRGVDNLAKARSFASRQSKNRKFFVAVKPTTPDGKIKILRKA